MTAPELCQIVSTQPPAQWPEKVTWPLFKAQVSIFGYKQVAMERSRNITLVEALVHTGLCESNGQAKAAIKANAVMVNRKKCNDAGRVLGSDDVLTNIDAIVIENGKYNFGIIEMC